MYRKTVGADLAYVHTKTRFLRRFIDDSKNMGLSEYFLNDRHALLGAPTAVQTEITTRVYFVKLGI